MYRGAKASLSPSYGHWENERVKYILGPLGITNQDHQYDNKPPQQNRSLFLLPRQNI